MNKMSAPGRRKHFDEVGPLPEKKKRFLPVGSVHKSHNQNPNTIIRFNNAAGIYHTSFMI